MLVPTIIMGGLAIMLILIGYCKGERQHISGLKQAFNLTVEIVPMLVFAFVVAGMVQVLLPRELISKWIGGESGLRGILIGTIAGGLSPGGPYVNFPLVAAFLHAGASMGTIIAFVTSWSLLAVSRLPLEVGILGWKFALIRTASCFFFPPVAGFIAQTFFGNAKL